MLQETTKEEIDQARPENTVRIVKCSDNDVLQKPEGPIPNVLIAGPGPEGVDFRQPSAAL